MRKENLLFNKQFKTNSTCPFLDGQRSVECDRRRVARDLCPKKYVVDDCQTKQRSESADVLVVYFSRLRAVTLKEFTLVTAGPRAYYFFCTLVRTDVMMHNRAAEVSSTAVRGGFDRFLMTPWMTCHNPSWYKNREALAQAANPTRENYASVPTHTSDAPRVGTGPENSVSQVERLHSEAAPGLGGGICVVVGDDVGNGRQPPVFFSCFQ